MAEIKYRPEIDGLRAFAVIPVILFHVGVGWLPGGFLGVDVFFVISGFLITSIINRELEQGTFSFRNFWARRIRRILPAMVVVTACTLAVTYVFVFRPEQQAIGEQALAALFSVANIYFLVNTGDYWGSAAEDSPFLHSWSLSVEEQFYLVFPLAIWLVFRYRPQWLQACLLTAVIASLALFLWGSNAFPTATFYLLPTRVWELGTGSLLAVVMSKQSSSNANMGVFGIAGLSMLLLSYVYATSLSASSGLAVIGTALVLAFGQSGLCQKLLSHRSVVHIGKISYSLYLWHWPVLVLAKPLGLEWPGSTDKPVLLLLIYTLAVVTYVFVEQPTRRRERVVSPVLASVFGLALIALAMASLPNSYDTKDFNQARFVDYSPNTSLTIHNGPRWMNIARERPRDHSGTLSNGGIRIGDESSKPDMIVVGDSHAGMWSDAIATIARDKGISTSFFPQCGEDWWESDFKRKRSHVYQYIEKCKPKVILVSLAWRRKSNRDENIKSFLEFSNAQGATVLLVEDPPWLLPCGDRSSIQWLASKGIIPNEANRQYLAFEDERPDQGGRHFARALADSYDFCRFVPIFDLFVAPSGVLVLDGKDVVYIDDDHLSSHGAHLAIGRLEEAITSVLEKE